MAEPSPARLYATLVGALLLIGGIAGFFFGDSWDDLLHMTTGALGLLVAGFAARFYAKWIGLGYLGIALWGFIIGDGGEILGAIPVSTAGNVLHLAIGVLGVAAAAATKA